MPPRSPPCWTACCITGMCSSAARGAGAPNWRQLPRRKASDHPRRKTGHRDGKGVLMMNQDSELDAFKREIDLRQFAVSLGYQIDRRESWRGSTVLRRGGDKIVVKRNGNGHYVFFSVRDDRDNGTVIDLLQRRLNLSLGAVRQILRPWIGRPAVSSQFPKLEPAGPDRMRVEGAYRRMADAHRFSYTQPADRRLILTESAVDALSYGALFPDAEDQTRYASLGGKPSSRQRELLQATIAKLPAGAEIVAAFDADDAGRQMVEVIREAIASVAGRTGRGDLIFKAHLPTQEGEDWNMVLQNVGLV